MKYNTAAPDDHEALIQHLRNEVSNSSATVAAAFCKVQRLKDEKADDEAIQQAKVGLAAAQSKHDATREQLQTLERQAGR